MADLAKGIAPDSTAYGDRQKLEAGLSSLPGNGAAPSGGPSAGPSQAGPSPVDTSGDPLSMLLNGAVQPQGNLPLTDGLSAGPGFSPGGPDQNPKHDRLRQIASQAPSPVVRAMARNELRRIVRQGV